MSDSDDKHILTKYPTVIVTRPIVHDMRVRGCYCRSTLYGTNRIKTECYPLVLGGCDSVTKELVESAIGLSYK